MSHKLINHSSDLKKLRNEGFEVEVKGGYLLVYNVPYVNASKQVLYDGMLLSKLTLAGDTTAKPGDHVIFFKGDHPCDKDGNIIRQIQHSTADQTFEDITVNHSFSSQPENGYSDYYEMFVTYIRIISAPAAAIDPSATAKTFKVIDSEDSDDVFQYIDTNSSRAAIDDITSKLTELKIAIVGLGGTGSYILDLLSKTKVQEIHLFDGDILLQHNAFRIPGAISKDRLSSSPYKADYLSKVYTEIHKYITAHCYDIESSNIDELSGMNFVFICIDRGDIKKEIINKLLSSKIPFIDVGVGIYATDSKLNGSIRITTYYADENSSHAIKRIPLSADEKDEYSSNIQIAELNALNAALAVIKWKKMIGFYHDLERENNAVYNIEVNKIINDTVVS